MKSAFFNLLKQDTLLSKRNGLLLVTVITLGVIILLYWTLPLMVRGGHTGQLFLDETEGKVLEAFLQSHDPEGKLLVQNREELRRRIGKTAGQLGIVAEGNRLEIKFTLIYNTPLAPENLNIIKAVLRNLSAEIAGKPFGEPLLVESLRPQSDPVPLNKSMIAILLAFEVMILGFLFVAVVVFGEKREGSIRAYRVTPSGLTNYVLSKTLLFTGLSTVYGIVMTLATIGSGVNYGALTAVLLLSCAFMTFLGLGIAVFFKNISEWFVPGVVVLSINMLSLLPYRFPVYSSFWLTLLPGYRVIFGVSEILFPTGKSGFLLPTLGTLGLQVLLAGIFAFLAVRKKMMKEE